MIDIKEGQEVRATLDRISFDIECGRAYFTLVDCCETFTFVASTLEQRAEFALSRAGDDVCVQVDKLPPEGRVCDAVKFINCNLYVKH